MDKENKQSEQPLTVRSATAQDKPLTGTVFVTSAKGSGPQTRIFYGPREAFPKPDNDYWRKRLPELRKQEMSKEEKEELRKQQKTVLNSLLAKSK